MLWCNLKCFNAVSPNAGLKITQFFPPKQEGVIYHYPFRIEFVFDVVIFKTQISDIVFGVVKFKPQACFNL